MASITKNLTCETTHLHRIYTGPFGPQVSKAGPEETLSTHPSMDPSHRRRAMGKRVGKYELGRTLGEGTFGKVKFAVNTETGEMVAIKVGSGGDGDGVLVRFRRTWTDRPPS